MHRKIDRSYTLHRTEVREAILAWLKAKDLQRPDYIGDTPTCRWIDLPADGGVRIEWTEEGSVDV